eukprot:9503684-Pyramimonas_sp.AAC.1
MSVARFHHPRLPRKHVRCVRERVAWKTHDSHVGVALVQLLQRSPLRLDVQLVVPYQDAPRSRSRTPPLLSFRRGRHATRIELAYDRPLLLRVRL